jgi:hypothetical protein
MMIGLTEFALKATTLDMHLTKG